MWSLRRPSLRFVLVGCVALALAGCGTVDTHRVVSGHAYTPHAGPVAIGMEGAPVPPDLEEVAIIQAVGRGTKANMPSVIDGLIHEAQSLGCTHIVRVRIDQGNGMTSGSGVAGRLRPAGATVEGTGPAPAPTPKNGTPAPNAAPPPGQAPAAAPEVQRSL